MNDEIPAMLVKTIPGITNNWEKYGSYFKKEEIRAKKIILNEGEIAKRIYFIESGCIRMFFTDANKDVSVQFFFEDTLICSMESFLKHLPSKFSLETLETGTYYTLSKDNYLKLIVELPEFNSYFQDLIQSRMFYYINLLLDYIRLSPQQRYIALLNKHPEILQRVPQYHIASYLGITAVSYSRIRNRK